MRANFSVGVMAFFLGACSHPGLVDRSDVSLDGVFRQLVAMSSEKRYDEALHLLSDETSRETKEHLTQAQVAEYFSAVVQLGGVIVKKANAFEERNLRSACLTIVGYDTADKPVSLSTGFTMEKRSWKVDSFHLVYHESPGALPSKPACLPKQ